MKKPMKTLTIRLDGQTLKELEKQAHKRAVYTTTWARELIVRGLLWTKQKEASIVKHPKDGF